MFKPLCRPIILVLLALSSCVAGAQVLGFPTGDPMQSMTSVDAISNGALNFSIFTINSQNPDGSPLQTAYGSISQLDLKAPGKAQHEYDKGYQFLMKKDLPSAVAHLATATKIYSSYVAAHNALGTAYLDLKQNSQARDEFAEAVKLDDHLPNSYLNLGIADLALNENAGAEEAFRKASSIAPLDHQLEMALTYGEFANHDYPAVIDTANQLHAKKHPKTSVVHFFAAGAEEAQNNLPEAEHQMEILLREDPKSPSADEFRHILEQMKTEQVHRGEPPKAAELASLTYSTNADPTQTAAEGSHQAQQVLQDIRTRNQIAEAEAAANDTSCTKCGTLVASNTASVKQPGINFKGTILHSSADEVGIFFAATDHGKSVTDLTEGDIEIRDQGTMEKIRAFRNQSQLPLRLGLIIDTSESVTRRFSFEQGAANKFLQGVVTSPEDLAFVIGVNNSVLLVQDFTADTALATHTVNQLAPGGGTALWDAVAFAAEKLADRRETEPVARALVVISDGKDNSSSASLKEAIASSVRGEVAIYTVSTRDLADVAVSDSLGEKALRTLSDLTGGAAFVPGSVKGLNRSLADLQQVMRGRYLISYKPASFTRDGSYRKIEITAQKNGHEFKIYARKGYYAGGLPAAADE